MNKMQDAMEFMWAAHSNKLEQDSWQTRWTSDWEFVGMLLNPSGSLVSEEV